MIWLDEVDLAAARRFARMLHDAQTTADVRRTVLDGLTELVGADLASWNRISLAAGAIEHEATPADAEPPGAFASQARTAAEHPLLHPHAVASRRALRLSEAVEPRRLHRTSIYADLLHRSGSEYGVSIGVGRTSIEMHVVALGRHEREFSVRDLDLLDLVAPAVAGGVGRAAAREEVGRATAREASSQRPATVPPAARGPQVSTAVVWLDRNGEIEQSSFDGERWLAEHFGVAEHPAWLPEPVASWLALPPRPPLVSERPGRRLTVTLVPGERHALLLEERVEGLPG